MKKAAQIITTIYAALPQLMSAYTFILLSHPYWIPASAPAFTGPCLTPLRRYYWRQQALRYQACILALHHFGDITDGSWHSGARPAPLPYTTSAIFRATYTPLAEAWDNEWVTPLPSPMIYSPLCFVSRWSSIATSIL